MKRGLTVFLFSCMSGDAYLQKKLSCSCNAVGYSFVDFSLLPSMQLRDQAPLRTRQHSHAKAKIDSVLSTSFNKPSL